MNSVYYTDKTLQSFYDLKGSVTGREAKPHHDVKKDNDLRRLLPEGALALRPETRARVRQQIVADCDFMRKMKIMDYSMLVGIHHIPTKRKGSKVRVKSSSMKGFRFSDNRRERFKSTDGARSSSSIPANSSSGHSRSTMNESKRSESLLAGLLEKRLSTTDATRVGLDRKPSKSRVVFQDDDSTLGPEKQLSLLSEYGVEDDDDNSYLEGSPKNTTVAPIFMDEAEEKDFLALERKKEETIQQVYWPFHGLFDIHGHRRSVPPTGADAEPTEIPGVHVPGFVEPLSDRKDGGLEMDTTDVKRPMTTHLNNGQELRHDSRIFYMGIIDILQQYNARKRVEARYHRLRGAGWQDASCVHPKVYAERFIRFFDEYSQRLTGDDLGLEEGEEGVTFEQDQGTDGDTKGKNTSGRPPRPTAFTDGLVSSTETPASPSAAGGREVELTTMKSESSFEVTITKDGDKVEETKQEEK